jgi:hypothetical protein
VSWELCGRTASIGPELGVVAGITPSLKTGSNMIVWVCECFWACLVAINIDFGITVASQTLC